MTTLLALLRGINVSGHRKVPMAELRELATGIGLVDVETHIQSGNLIGDCTTKAALVAAQLEQAIERHFGFFVDVVVRSRKQWDGYVAANPFAAASKAAPNHVMLALSKGTLAADAAVLLQQKATAGEQVQLAGGALWIHYAGGVAKSKLTPALFNRCAGSPVTARNWNTVQRLAAMLAAR